VSSTNRGGEGAIEPYYRSDDGLIRIFHARMEDVLAAGIVEPKEIALIHADAPYGVRERTDRAKKRRGIASGGACPANDFPPVAGDDVDYDPAPLLALDRPLVLWGANHYAPRVPASPSWLVWDKRDGVDSDDNADGELAWSNLGGPLRTFHHLWRGMIKASERDSRRLGPTQKPEALSAWVFGERAKLRRGDLVFVPYLGTGPDLNPALSMGLRVIACDVEEWCCRTAVAARLGAVVKQEPANTLGPLFKDIA
jgi:hypothetical protein